VDRECKGAESDIVNPRDSAIECGGRLSFVRFQEQKPEIDNLDGKLPMKVLIEIPTEHYDLFVAECDPTSQEYSIQKSVNARDQVGEPARRVVQIRCDEEEALTLLGAAFQVYPDVTRAISTAIDRALKS
jgi:hypothetical protein